MIRIRPLLAASLLAALACGPASAGSSAWHHVEGGAVRLVTSSEVDGDGLLRGALEIRLKPGWKTYWMDPGSSGVPPTLEVEAAGEPVETDVAFPAPQRFDDGYGDWAGYDHSVALALTLRLPEGDAVPDLLEANTFLGVCETICIPVQAKLSVQVHSSEDTSEHETIVAAAFGALPGPARPGFEAQIVEATDDMLLLKASAPAGAEIADIHIAGGSKQSFGRPVRNVEDGQTMFSVTLHSRAEIPAGTSFPYTLVTSSGAVTGLLDLP